MITQRFSKAEAAASREPFFLWDRTYQVLRQYWPDLMPVYLLGAVPFLLGCVWSVYRLRLYHATADDMAELSLLMLMLFCWKNFCQWCFCRKLYELLRAEVAEEAQLPWRQRLEMFIRMNMVHSSGVLLLALACINPWLFLAPVLLMLPLYSGWTACCAWNPGETWRKMIDRLFKWLGGNRASLLLGLILMAVAWAVIMCNFMAVCLITALAAKALLGYDSAFSLTPSYFEGVWGNSTIWTILVALTWLTVDPIGKTWAALRIFHQESRVSGWDLRSRLRKLRKNAITILIMLLLACGINSSAAESAEPITSEQLESQIDQTMTSLEFRWRQPVPPKPPESDSSAAYLKVLADMLSDALEAVAKFFDFKFKHEKQNSSNMDFSIFSRLEVFAKFLLVAVAAGLIIWFIRYYFKYKQKLLLPRTVPPSRKMPDLTANDVCADELEQDEWRKLAHELKTSGDFRQAVRALYLCGIAALADCRMLTVARGKTDFEYVRELWRRSHSIPDAGPLFNSEVNTFQRIWYGDYPADLSTVEVYEKQLDQLLTIVGGGAQ
ncbi:MAG: hypothetical protein ACYC4Q_07805 [Victivallaceae bacterium]